MEDIKNICLEFSSKIEDSWQIYNEIDSCILKTLNFIEYIKNLLDKIIKTTKDPTLAFK